MRQYQRVRAAYPDAVLFFALIGIFYDAVVFEDARDGAAGPGGGVDGSAVEGENAVLMAGVPYHAVETVLLHRMMRGGYGHEGGDLRADGESAGGRRGESSGRVTRLVTPAGCWLRRSDPLDVAAGENFLLRVAMLVRGDGGEKQEASSKEQEGVCAIAWCELSTGKFLTYSGSLAACGDELMRLRPRELVYAESSDHRVPEWLEGVRGQLGAVLSGRPAWQLDGHHASQTLKTHYGVSTFAGFGYANEKELALRAAGGLVAYLHETQKAALEHLQAPRGFEHSRHLLIDPVSLRSLEVLRTLRGNAVEGSLVAAIDRTQTPMGSRLLRNWLCYPLQDIGEIRKRQDAIELLVGEEALLAQLRGILAECSDVERITARICCRRGSPRDFVALARSLEALGKVGRLMANSEFRILSSELVEEGVKLAERIRGFLAEEVPGHLRDGGVIREGCSAELDRLRGMSRDSRTFLAEYQAKLVARAGIPSLKVGYNKVFGFYIEVTNTHAEKIPADFIRKQTVKNAERYITPELKQYESEILTAQERGLALEQELFEGLRAELAGHVGVLQKLAMAAATLDVTCGLAHLARTRHYCRPVVTAEKVLGIVDGRHPVVEQGMGERFVPNDTWFGEKEEARSKEQEGGGGVTLHLITGPTMAGKSTYIREVALLVLMAQAGAFIPAKSATIGIVDRIFTPGGGGG